MHQLGPPQRVPSLVEARRATLAKPDTLFTHPYLYPIHTSVSNIPRARTFRRTSGS